MNQTSPRYALITGAAGGIGRALVQEFHANGYSVIAMDMMPQPADMPCVEYVHADLEKIVADPAYGNNVIADLKVVIGHCGLRALINNAAVQILGSADSLTREDWERTLKVNLLAPFFLAQALLPDLEQANGCIVNVSSIHARLTKKDFIAYATSKAALSGMTRAMAIDLGGRVRVNAIEPAAIDTEMLKAGFLDNPAGYHQLQAYHPQGKIGLPDEVATCALVIANGSMPFLHGACIPLDGGIGACLHDPK